MQMGDVKENKIGDFRKKSPERIATSGRLRQELSAALNRIHNTAYKERFWGLLLEEYIRSVITRRAFMEREELKRKADLYPVNSHGFQSRGDKLKDGMKRFLKHLGTRKNIRYWKKALKDGEEEFHIDFPVYEGFKNEKLGIELPVIHLFIAGRGEKIKRDRANQIAKNAEDRFLENAIRQLPGIYVEYFEAWLNQIPLYKPGNKTFHVHGVRTLMDRALLAKYTENGARLYWYQHGSHYGEYQNEYLHHLEHLFADEFRTWGWKLKEKDVPWKAYRLEKFRSEYTLFKNKMETNLLLCYPKMYDKYREHCIEVTRYFTENLNFDKYPNITARPRPLHQKHGHEDELGFIPDGKMKISSGLISIAEEVSKSGLIIQLNVPGTNFLECISVDHPTTGLLTNDQPTEIVKPFYDFMLETGILHKNTESLVRHLNRIDPKEWWGEVTSKPMYKEFKKTFCGKDE